MVLSMYCFIYRLCGLPSFFLALHLSSNTKSAHVHELMWNSITAKTPSMVWKICTRSTAKIFSCRKWLDVLVWDPALLNVWAAAHTFYSTQCMGPRATDSVWDLTIVNVWRHALWVQIFIYEYMYDKNTKFMHARKSIRLFFCIYRDFNPTSPYTW